MKRKYRNEKTGKKRKDKIMDQRQALPKGYERDGVKMCIRDRYWTFTIFKWINWRGALFPPWFLR